MYDLPLYRPPSEGDNLIIQVTRGCGYNTCTFCSMYKAAPYRVRPLDDVFRGIDQAAAQWPDAHRVFLADGDALGLPMDALGAILAHLAARLPRLQRVSAYATPLALLKKTPEDLAALKAARLSLLYVGIESGSDVVLAHVRKGATQRGIVEALTKARHAGLKVSATVILGLGGQALWREHVEATAALVNQAPPQFLSTLQLTLAPDAIPAFLAGFDGAFTAQDDAAILAEQRHLLALLAPPAPVVFRSNHASNCLALAGGLPKDRDRLLAQIDEAMAGARRLRPAALRGL